MGQKAAGKVADAKSPGGIDSILKVSGTKIVDGKGNEVVLKGAGLGGHMNMENFITGFSGHERQHRAAILAVLGKEKYEYFFEKFLDYFFTRSDAKYFASLGLNCVRIPFNYQHFEEDSNPGVYLEQGFKLLDRVVEHCAAEGLYVILDLHAVPGGQNQDWHSDSGMSEALFWRFREFQDRVVNLWIEIAKRYKGNPYVAGYNPLNEPADPQHVNLTSFYTRIEKEIRKIDPDHILFLDGNTYAMDFRKFDTVLPNCVYSMHDYSIMGFPMQEQFEGTAAQKTKLRASFERKVEFMRQKKVPIWNGEFGPVYAFDSEADSEKTNAKRYALLKEQLSVYAETNVSWSIWLYKDIGYQGMMYVPKDSAWFKLLGPFIEKKAKLGVDFWGRDDKDVGHIYAPIKQHFQDVVPKEHWNKKYPSPLWDMSRHIDRVVRECLLSEYLAYEMADYFKGKSFEELDELAASFKFENCVQRKDLNDILQKDAEKAEAV
ncbi:glycoside hydrolase family 5 protein [Cadophora sp. MPI-SDFR-AT-0126]|nr:glycoside hydrolase family 5 protein [Leotiomycetes sp. MPI-SDFR-AT-0126]